MKMNETNSVPDSCCKELSEGCGRGKMIPDSLEDIYTDGCLNKIVVTIKDNIIWVALAAGCIVAIQVAIVCVACCLGNTMKKAQYEKKWNFKLRIIICYYLFYLEIDLRIICSQASYIMFAERN